MMMKIITLFLMLFVVMFAKEGGLRAEISSESPPGYSLDLFMSHEYIDNLYLTNKKEKDDFISLLGASFTANKDFQVSDLFFNYKIARSFYWQYSKNNAFRHSLSLKYLREFTKKLSLSFDNNFYRSEEPVEENKEIFREHKNKRDIYYRNISSLILSYYITRTLSFDIGASLNYYQDKNPDNEDSRIYTEFIRINKEYTRYFWNCSLNFIQREFQSDPQVNSWGVDSSFGYKLSSNKNISLNLSLERTQEMGIDSEDYWAYQGAIKYDFSPSPDQEYWFTLGYYYRDQDGTSDNDKGLSYSINYMKFYRYTTVKLSGSGGYRYEYGEAENTGFTEYYLLNVDISRDFSRTLRGELGGMYRYEDFKDEDRTDKTWEFYASIKKKFLQRLYLQARYNYRHVNSDLEGESYTENIIQLFLIYNFWRGQTIW